MMDGSQGYRSRRGLDEPWIEEWTRFFPQLSMRLFHALVKHGYTVADARSTPDAQLKKLRNIGKISLAELRAIAPYERGTTNRIVDSLDAAWAEAEAALPEGWRIVALRASIHGWSARVTGPAIQERAADWHRAGPGPWSLLIRGPTPAEALRALAAVLRR